MYTEDKIRKMPTQSILRRLAGYMGKQKWLLVLAIFVTVILTGIQLSFPYLTKVAIDNYIISTVQLIEVDQEGIEFINSYDTEALTKLEGNLYAIKTNTLSQLPTSYVKDLYDNGKLGKGKFYIFQVPFDQGLWESLDYRVYGNIRLVSDNAMRQLSVRKILELRKSDIAGVKRIAYIFLILLFTHLGLTFASIFALAYTGQMVMYRIRKNIFTHLQRLRISFFDRIPSGRLVTRTTNDAEKLNEFFTDVLTGFFQDVFLCLGVMIVMFRLQPKLSLVTYALLPIIAIVITIFRIKVRKVYHKVRELLSKLNSRLAEYLNGIKVIQLFNQERGVREDFGDVNENYYRANIRQIIVYGVFRPSIDLLASIGIALIIWYGGGEVIKNAITLGMLVAFISYIEMFFRPIQDISERFNIAEDAMVASERVFTLLDNKEGELNTGKIKKARLGGKIEFRNVWHRYNGEWILKDLSFLVNPKERIAIVGPTGAGKTSIISLLPRFYECEKGTILIDDVPISEYDLDSLRRNTGIVMQDVFLFAGSIKDNIKLHNSDIKDNDIKLVSEYVNADKFITKLPQTYDTDVKERGTRLSIGERQLLSFARALATDPTILILDEATSSVDSETEALIQDAISKLLQERTSIVIAHRLSTIKTVDRIMVIDKGRIIEEGRHNDLIKKKGMYYALYKLQYLK